MLRYIVRRGIAALITIAAISVISFTIINLPPGDFISSYIAQLEATGTVLAIGEAETLRAQYGLDEPYAFQYLRWMWKAVHWDFGVSFEYNRPVAGLIGDRILLTAALTFTTIIFTWILAIPIGIYSAVRQYSLADYTFTFIGFMGLAIPNFLIALVVLYLGFVWFGASIGGLFSAEYQEAPYSVGKVWDLMKHLWMPALILALSGTADLIRILRANLLDELRKPYVVTARAKGLPEFRLILKYPVRVALNPLISTIGYRLPLIVSGSIIVSVVMSLPTVGPLLLKSLLAQDMFLAGTIILMIGVLTVVGTFISDLALGVIDPRIRLEST